MRIFPDNIPFSPDDRFDSERMAVQVENARKKRRYAYLAWLCFGSHHLYLKRPLTQVFFWLTLGGLLLWWIRDLFRVPELVRQYNQRAAAKLLEALHEGGARHVAPQAWTPPPWPVRSSPEVWEEPPLAAPVVGPVQDEVFDQPLPARNAWNARKSSAAVLAGTSVVVLALYIATPPPLEARSALEPKFRTLRGVNVRDAPSTSGPIRAVIKRGVVLRGRVESVGSTKWLWITRGAQADRYVALRNLEKA